MRWSLLALLLPLLPAQEEPGAVETPARQYAKLNESYEAASRKWMSDYRAAAQAKDRKAIDELMKNRAEAEFLPRFLALAEEHAGTGDAVPFLVWVATRGFTDRDAMLAAITTLVDDHVASAELAPVASRLDSFAHTLGKQRVREMLTRIVEHNGHPEVQAHALMARGEMYVGTRAGDATDEQRAAALADLRRAAALTGDGKLAERAKNAVHEEENLGVGKVAPDIVGQDLDGVEFKLSDYRGKVVMLDFWGDW